MSFRRLYTLERDKVGGDKFHSIKFTRGEDFTDDPITLVETKAHLIVTFDDDDTLITALINQSIAAIEKHCSISILQKTVTVLADIFCETELPYCPLLEFTKLELKTGPNAYVQKTVNTDFQIDGDAGDYARLIPGVAGRMKLTYDTGFAEGEIPDDLKLAVLNEIAFRYENRGDSTNRYAQQNVGISESAMVLANPFIRMQWT